MLFSVSSTGGSYRKPYSALVLKLRTKKSNHEYHFEEQKKEGKNQTKTRVWGESSLCPETSTKTSVQEYHLSRDKATKQGQGPHW
jgi:hypothetical protein